MTRFTDWSPLSKLAKFAVLWVMLFIIYLSLFPLTEWRADSLTGLNSQELYDLAHKTIFHFPKYWTKFDVITNLIAYIPLGAVLFWSFSHTSFFSYQSSTSRNIIFFVFSTLIGLMLSMSMETLQFFLPSRIPSVLDVLANTGGTILGGLWAWLKHRKHSYLMPWWRSDHSFGYILIILWLLAQLVWQNPYKNSLIYQAIYIPELSKLSSVFAFIFQIFPDNWFHSLTSFFDTSRLFQENSSLNSNSSFGLIQTIQILEICNTVGHLLLPCLLILGQLNWSEHLHTPKIRPFLLFLTGWFAIHVYRLNLVDRHASEVLVESLNALNNLDSLNSLATLEEFQGFQTHFQNLLTQWNESLSAMNYNETTLLITFVCYLILAVLPSKWYGRILFFIWIILVFIQHVFHKIQNLQVLKPLQSLYPLQSLQPLESLKQPMTENINVDVATSHVLNELNPINSIHPAWQPLYELLQVIYDFWFIPFLLYVVLYTVYYNKITHHESTEQ